MCETRIASLHESDSQSGRSIQTKCFLDADVPRKDPQCYLATCCPYLSANVYQSLSCIDAVTQIGAALHCTFFYKSILFYFCSGRWLRGLGLLLNRQHHMTWKTLQSRCMYFRNKRELLSLLSNGDYTYRLVGAQEQKSFGTHLVCDSLCPEFRLARAHKVSAGISNYPFN